MTVSDGNIKITVEFFSVVDIGFFMSDRSVFPFYSYCRVPICDFWNLIKLIKITVNKFQSWILERQIGFSVLFRTVEFSFAIFGIFSDVPPWRVRSYEDLVYKLYQRYSKIGNFWILFQDWNYCFIRGRAVRSWIDSIDPICVTELNLRKANLLLQTLK